MVFYRMRTLLLLLPALGKRNINLGLCGNRLLPTRSRNGELPKPCEGDDDAYTTMNTIDQVQWKEDRVNELIF